MSEKKPVSRQKNVINQKAVVEKKEKVETALSQGKKRRSFFDWLFGKGDKK